MKLMRLAATPLRWMAASLLSHMGSFALVKKPGDLRIINIGGGHHRKASADGVGTGLPHGRRL